MTPREIQGLADRLRWIDQQHHGISFKLAEEVCKKLPDIVKGLDIAVRGVAQEAWRCGDSAPPVKRGHMKEFILAVHREHSGKVYTFACSYLNAYPLNYEYECPKGDGCAGVGCDDGCPTTGWFLLTGDDDNDSGQFNSLSLKGGDKIMGWQSIPQWGVSVSSTEGK